ncbi:C45 family autoproteolytic acyltransferase/hydrolase, partial [Acidobacteriota bacterium]
MKIVKIIGRPFLALILTLIFSSLTISSNEQKDVSGPTPPSIMPVVFLQGSNYDMGYQYGQQAGPSLVLRKEANWALASGKRSREEVLHMLKAYQWYIKQYAPEIIEEMEGMAAGAENSGYDISYTDVLLMQTGPRIPDPDWSYPKGAEKEVLNMACSSWAAWGSATTDGRLILGDSQDRPFFHSNAIIAFPDNGNSYVSPGIVGYIAHKPALNSKGVCVGVTGGAGQRKEDHDYGIPFHCAIQHLMRFADTAEEAKNMLLSWKLAENTSWLISDMTGGIYAVECTSAVKSIRKPGDFGEKDFLYITNNYFNKEMKEAAQGIKFIAHAGWIGKRHG